MVRNEVKKGKTKKTLSLTIEASELLKKNMIKKGDEGKIVSDLIMKAFGVPAVASPSTEVKAQ